MATEGTVTRATAVALEMEGLRKQVDDLNRELAELRAGEY